MTTSFRTSIVPILLLVFFADTDSHAYQKAKSRIQTRSITGTYKHVLNSMEVLELPNHKVRISFNGFWPNDRRRVGTRNVGTFDETVPLNGRTATVKIQYGSDPCILAIEFKANKSGRLARRIDARMRIRLQCGSGWNVCEGQQQTTRPSDA